MTASSSQSRLTLPSRARLGLNSTSRNNLFSLSCLVNHIHSPSLMKHDCILYTIQTIFVYYVYTAIYVCKTIVQFTHKKGPTTASQHYG